jgi:hypothetical protein
MPACTVQGYMSGIGQTQAADSLLVPLYAAEYYSSTMQHVFTSGSSQRCPLSSTAQALGSVVTIEKSKH